MQMDVQARAQQLAGAADEGQPEPDFLPAWISAHEADRSVPGPEPDDRLQRIAAELTVSGNVEIFECPRQAAKLLHFSRFDFNGSGHSLRSAWTRSSNSARSRAFDARAAARSNSARASASRPSRASRSPRTLGSHW